MNYTRRQSPLPFAVITVLATLMFVGVGCAAARLLIPKSVERWEAAIAAFEEQDAKAMPEPGGIVFVGSSTIRGWKVEEAFPNHNVINRGFGGSMMVDAAYFANRIVTPYKPAKVVIYSGDNDLGSDQTPQEIAGELQKLVETVKAELPDTKFAVISVKPSGLRWSMIDKLRAVNDEFEAYCARTPNVTFIDIEQKMLGEDGRPRGELFRADQLHLSPAGYEILNEAVRPFIEATETKE